MKISPIFLASSFAAALVVSAALPVNTVAMPAPINRGVEKDANGNLAPNVDTRLDHREEAKEQMEEMHDLREERAEEATKAAAVGNNTSGSFTTDKTGVTNNTSGSFNTNTSGGTGTEPLRNNTSGGINSNR